MLIQTLLLYQYVIIPFSFQSTVLVLGWYLSHPLGRRIFGESHFKELRLRSPRYFSFGKTVHAQSPIQPLSIRPLSYSSSIEEETSNTNSFHSSFTSSSGDVNDLLTHQRGPFTAEEVNIFHLPLDCIHHS